MTAGAGLAAVSESGAKVKDDAKARICGVKARMYGTAKARHPAARITSSAGCLKTDRLTGRAPESGFRGKLRLSRLKEAAVCGIAFAVIFLSAVRAPDKFGLNARRSCESG